MNHIMKASSRLFALVCVLALVAAPAQAQSTPMATYNTDHPRPN